MRSTLKVSLPPELKRWVDEQVKAGPYGTASEYVRDLLCQARDRQVCRSVDAALAEAVESGATTKMDGTDWAALRRAARAMAQGNALQKPGEPTGELSRRTGRA